MILYHKNRLCRFTRTLRRPAELATTEVRFEFFVAAIYDRRRSIKFKVDDHPGAQDTTPPESRGEFLQNSPPQMRRGGALSAGVVSNADITLTRR